jgi:hypothetical protein
MEGKLQVSYVIHGRCRSGSRWFWIAAELGRSEEHKCGDPVCIYGGPHEYGWEDAEDLALKAMADAHPDRGGTNEGFMAAEEAYKHAKRRAAR